MEGLTLVTAAGALLALLLLVVRWALREEVGR